MGGAAPVWLSNWDAGWLLDLLCPGREGPFIGLLGLLLAGLKVPVGDEIPAPTAQQRFFRQG